MNPRHASILENSKEKFLQKIKENVLAYPEDFPTVVSDNNRYGHRPNGECWTESFWTGMVWLAYELSGDPIYKTLATKHSQSFKERLEKNLGLEHHDVGFLYTLSCIADHRLTGSKEAKNTAIAAADKLMQRYKEKGAFIQAWGANGDPNNYRLIIDCYMNLPLLYWASQVTGNPNYQQAATNHAHTARKVVIREDHSTYHTYYFDPETGLPKQGTTHQGYANDSCWARGQAWAIYGMALCYRYTKDPVFLNLFYQVTDYFMAHLPEDKVPYWDLYFTEGDEERDSSAAAIAICGIMEMVTQVSNEKMAAHQKQAEDIMVSMIEHYSTFDMPEANGLLLHGVYSKPRKAGVNEMTLWGDYFFLEAYTRITTPWHPYW